MRSIAGVVLFVLSACRPCEPPLIIDNGRIPDSILNDVPYQDGHSYKFRHSGGLVIEFASTRQSREEWLRCERCCKYEYKYEVNSTTLIPDYPVFNFGLDISNPDSANFQLTARVGYYYFYIPAYDYPPENVDFTDSVLLDGKIYRNVFKLKSNYGSYYDRDILFADSMYYSYERGIIQIKMSNGEKYSIDE